MSSNSFFSALPGAHAPGRVHSPTIWLVETEIAFSVDQQYFSRTTSEANCGESARRFFEKYFHKNGDISRSSRQISLRSFQSEAFCMSIRMVQARGLGKFRSSRTTNSKVGEMDRIFGKVISGELKLIFFGPAGGSRTRKGAFAHHMASRDGDCFLCRSAILF